MISERMKLISQLIAKDWTCVRCGRTTPHIHLVAKDEDGNSEKFICSKATAKDALELLSRHYPNKNIDLCFEGMCKNGEFYDFEANRVGMVYCIDCRQDR